MKKSPTRSRTKTSPKKTPGPKREATPTRIEKAEPAKTPTPQPEARGRTDPPTGRRAVGAAAPYSYAANASVRIAIRYHRGKIGPRKRTGASSRRHHLRRGAVSGRGRGSRPIIVTSPARPSTRSGERRCSARAGNSSSCTTAGRGRETRAPSIIIIDASGA